MNTDYRDVKGDKKQISVVICENLCPNSYIFQLRMWLFELILRKLHSIFPTISFNVRPPCKIG